MSQAQLIAGHANLFANLHPNIPNPYAQSAAPPGISAGRLAVGIAMTAMGALAALQNGTAIPLVVNDIFAPIR
jgi:hypothetical protein